MKSLLRILVIACLSTACSKNNNSENSGQTEPANKPVAYATNYPLAYFATRISGQVIDVRLAPPPDIDPAFWKPLAKDIHSMQTGDVIICNGASYESWLSSVSLPTSRLLDTSSSFSKKLIPLHTNETHSHGPGGEHAHTGTAFTTWLDFSLSIRQAENIRDALVSRWPDHESLFTEEYNKLRQDLEALDREFMQVVTTNPRLPVLFSHPVYQYAERRYGINGRSLHWEPDEMPSEQMWAKLDLILRNHPAKIMIWEAAPLPETVARLKTMEIESYVFSPCARALTDGNFLSVMKKNLINLQKVYKVPQHP
jgi:zinc transport system substrate-binding protein